MVVEGGAREGRVGERAEGGMEEEGVEVARVEGSMAPREAPGGRKGWHSPGHSCRCTRTGHRVAPQWA